MPPKGLSVPKLTGISLAGRMKGIAHVPRPGAMKHFEPRATTHHPQLGVSFKKPSPPKLAKPRSPAPGKPGSSVPKSSLAGRLKPLSLGKPKTGRPPKRK